MRLTVWHNGGREICIEQRQRGIDHRWVEHYSPLLNPTIIGYSHPCILLQLSIPGSYFTHHPVIFYFL